MFENRALFIGLLMLAATALQAGVTVQPAMPASNHSSSVTATQQFLQTRDYFLQYFAQADSLLAHDDSLALQVLQKQLTELLGPVQVAGFAEQGRLNRVTLNQEAGVEQVDGLQFQLQSDMLFVTTTALLQDFLLKHPQYPSPLPKLLKTAHWPIKTNFYSAVFAWDAAVLNYMDIPIKHGNKQVVSQAFLGAYTQDVVPETPDRVFVFSIKDDKVFMLSALTSIKIPTIQACKLKRDKMMGKSSSQKPHSAKAQKNAKAQAWQAYQQCFARSARQQPFFSVVNKQAQMLVDRL
ncbi:hypothetical protein [Methylomonas sp. AM2-LC]|uniref:hypothetical protein n=1 Tax=Methylomonas sp. AM2-LC TaxID=3153301 RepID=UPI003266F938